MLLSLTKDEHSAIISVTQDWDNSAMASGNAFCDTFLDGWIGKSESSDHKQNFLYLYQPHAVTPCGYH
jgi:hypothetical protein